MSVNVIYIFLALLGFGFLVLIHELGHFWVARRQGIDVEVFSIGFGKPLYFWQYRGVKWQICLIPLGGYVLFKGGDEKSGKSMYDVQGGFFSKTPWARIKVLLAGPLVNIAFAFIAFTMVWSMGGRLKPFEQYTKIIGSVDPQSELCQLGVKSGDTIEKYNGHPFHGFQDLIYHGIVKNQMIQISGEKINYYTGDETPYDYHLAPYHRQHDMKDLKTIGVTSPASILYFKGFDPTLGHSSPMFDSGIEEGDRIVWANGEIVFSTEQLRQIINQRSVILTVRQDDELKVMRVPRVPIADLELSKNEMGEFTDWRHAIGEREEVNELGFIPYQVDQYGFVKKEFSFIDDDLIKAGQKLLGISEEYSPLYEGDQILAVGDMPVDSGLEIFKALAKRDVYLIVKKRTLQDESEMTWNDQDQRFRESVQWQEVQKLASQIGTREMVRKMGDYELIGPIMPVTFSTFYRNAGVPEPQTTKEVRERLDLDHSEFIFLGSYLSSQMVVYNPNPWIMLEESAAGTWRTLSSLATGALSPKWLSGPVGIFKVMHDGWSLGIKEVLFWMGLISLNLGIFNLLPIPVLDGGRICLTLWEWATRRRISEKTLELILLPFFVMLVAVFLYTTYHDITRLFGG